MKQLKLDIPRQEIQALAIPDCAFDVQQDPERLSILLMIRIKLVYQLREIKQEGAGAKLCLFFEWRIQDFRAIEHLQFPVSLVVVEHTEVSKNFESSAEAVPQFSRTFCYQANLSMIAREENNNLVVFGEFVRAKYEGFR